MKLSLSTVAALIAATPLAAQATGGTFVKSGAGCPSQGAGGAIYEQFSGTGTGDLAGMSVLFSKAGDGWNIGACQSGCFETGFSNNLGSGDDSLLQVTLPFPFVFHGRTVASNIQIDSNGRVGLLTSSDFSESTTELLGDPEVAICAWWDDLNPSSAGGVYFDTFTNPDRAVITWNQVPQFSNTDVNTFQVTLYGNGDFRITWQAGCLDDAIVGFSSGFGVADPGPSDMSAVISGGGSLTGLGGIPLEIREAPGSVPNIGTTFDIDAAGFPSSTAAASLLLGFSAVNIDLTGFGAPGCTLYSSGDGLFPIALAGPVGSVSVGIPNNAGLVGLPIESQAVAIAPGANALNVVTSDQGTINIGREGRVVVIAQGANSFNNITSSGFFQVQNNSGLDIVSMQFDWVNSPNPAQSTMVFDTDQTGMADVPWGGNSTVSGCQGTYRQGSEVTTGLDFANSDVSGCDPTANTGYVGSNATSGVSFKTLDFAFTSFNSGDLFQFDCDTDGGAGIGGDDMDGMVITITLSDNTILSGTLQAIGTDLSRCDL